MSLLYALMLEPLNDLSFKAGWADMTDCHRCELGLELTAAHAFYHCPFWDHIGELTARIDPEHLVSIDLAICMR